MYQLIRHLYFDHPFILTLIGGGFICLAVLIHEIVSKIKGENYENPFLYFPGAFGFAIALFLAFSDKWWWSPLVFISAVVFSCPLVIIINFTVYLIQNYRDQEYKE